MTTITSHAHAYIDEYTALEDFLSGKAKPSILSFFAEDVKGYTYLGPCTITTECKPRDEIVTAQIETLKAMLQTVRADNQKRENHLLDKISKLTALTYDAEAA